MDAEIKNLACVGFTVMGSLCYGYFISAKFPKGLWRLISLAPIFLLYTLLPLFVNFAFFKAVTAFYITWLCNFKLLLFAFNQGPLSSNPPLHIFIATAALPIKIKQKNDPPIAPSPKKLPLNPATETVALAVLSTAVIRGYTDYFPFPSQILLILYACLVFLLNDLFAAFSSSLVRLLLGLELEPPSDEPYLSTSLQEFWGRRWNLTVATTLRQTVYKPVRSAAAAVVGKNYAPAVGVLAAFLVSGLMHELVFYYVNRVSPSWEMTLFFVLHGVCVLVEFGLKVAVGGKWRLPWFFSGPLTVGFVMATSFWLFFPPLVRNGADVKAIEEFHCFEEFVKEKIIKLRPSL